MKDFELIEHTADLKIRVYGKTPKLLFINALKGMFQSIRPKAPGCVIQNDRLSCSSLPKKRFIDLRSINIESLLVDFLSEALYLSDTYHEAYLDANIIYFHQDHIKAEILGVAIEGFEGVEIKAVTYHDLHIRSSNNVWCVDIVFDI